MPSILYSTNSFVAWHVNRKYYGDIHYAWCAPDLDAADYGPVKGPTPPTSSPLQRYRALKAEARGSDRHGFYLDSQRIGIRKGAVVKCGSGIINEAQRDEIFELVANTSPSDYRPLLYIIPVTPNVKPLIELVPVAERANPLMEEFLIQQLPGDAFQAVDLGDV